MRECVNEMSELSMACDLRTLTTIVLAEKVHTVEPLNNAGQRPPLGQKKVAVVESGLNKSECMNCPPRKVAVSGGLTV